MLNVIVYVSDWFGNEAVTSTDIKIATNYTTILHFPYKSDTVAFTELQTTAFDLDIHVTKCNAPSNSPEVQPGYVQVVATSRDIVTFTGGPEPDLSASLTKTTFETVLLRLTNLQRGKYYNFNIDSSSPRTSDVAHSTFTLFYNYAKPTLRIHGADRMLPTGRQIILNAIYESPAYKTSELRPITSYLWSFLDCTSLADNTKCDSSFAYAATLGKNTDTLTIPASALGNNQNITVQIQIWINDGSSIATAAEIYTINSDRLIAASAYITRRSGNYVYLSIDYNSTQIGRMASTKFEWTMVGMVNRTFEESMHWMKSEYLQQRYAEMDVIIGSSLSLVGNVNITYFNSTTSQIVGVDTSSLVPNTRYEFAVKQYDTENRMLVTAFLQYNHTPYEEFRVRDLVIAPSGGYGLITQYSFQIRVLESLYEDYPVHQIWMNPCPAVEPYFPATPPLNLRHFISIPLTARACGSQIAFKLRVFKKGAYKDFGPVFVQVIQSNNNTETNEALIKNYELLKGIVANPGIRSAFSFFTISPQVLESSNLFTNDNIHIVKFIIDTWDFMQARLFDYLDSISIGYYAIYSMKVFQRAISKYSPYITPEWSTSFLKSMYNLTSSVSNNFAYRHYDDSGVEVGGELEIMQEILNTLEALLLYGGYGAFEQVAYKTLMFEMLQKTAIAFSREMLPTGITHTLFSDPKMGELHVCKVDLLTVNGLSPFRSVIDPNKHLLELPTDMVKNMQPIENPASSKIYNLAVYVLTYQNEYNATMLKDALEYLDIGIYRTEISNGVESDPVIANAPKECVSNFSITFNVPVGVKEEFLNIYYYNETVKRWGSGDCTIQRIRYQVATVTCLPSVLIWGLVRTFSLGNLTFNVTIPPPENHKLFDIRNVEKMSYATGTGLYSVVSIGVIYSGLAILIIVVEYKYKTAMIKRALNEMFGQTSSPVKDISNKDDDNGEGEKNKQLFDAIWQMKVYRIKSHYTKISKIEPEKDELNTGIFIIKHC